jgi:acyl-CoA reductase-like NAD-dependent aldehyde dehydrogenase
MNYRNAPLVLGTRAIALPLAAGNSTILKGSEFCPKTFWTLGDIFRQAGLPKGCVNVLYHRPSDAAEVTTALIAHPAVKKINFTGSSHVGAIIAATAGKYIKPVLLELGGKAASIVLDDADLEKAAATTARAAFFHVSISPLGVDYVTR